MSAASVAAESILADADAALGNDQAWWLSLGPQKTRASTLRDIGAQLLTPSALRDPSDRRACEWARALASVAVAMREAFPDNLFWDLDAMGAALWRGSSSAAAVATHGEAIAAIQHLFGRRGPIGFAYVHDFCYGYDWAKWVSKAPQQRRDVAPFGMQFVDVMNSRGAQLLSLIQRGDDPRYPPLPGPAPRNPFGFSRAPADESRLHRYLAAADALPIAAWDVDATPEPTRPYAALRLQAAAELGLTDAG